VTKNSNWTVLCLNFGIIQIYVDCYIQIARIMVYFQNFKKSSSWPVPPFLWHGARQGHHTDFATCPVPSADFTSCPPRGPPSTAGKTVLAVQVNQPVEGQAVGCDSVLSSRLVSKVSGT
jgi:hypothetical protein